MRRRTHLERSRCRCRAQVLDPSDPISYGAALAPALAEPLQSDPMKPRALLPLSLMLGLAVAASSSHAQTGPRLEADYLALGLTLGPAGTVAVDVDPVQVDPMQMDAPAIGGLSSQSPLAISAGGAARYVFALHPNFALGAQFGVAAWRSRRAADQNSAHSWFFDLGIAPQARLPLGPSLELYLAVPLALTFSALSEAETWVQLIAVDNPAFGSVADVDPRFGYRVGAALGARLLLVDGFGVLLELGYLRDAVVHPVEVRFTESSAGSLPGTQLDLAIVTHQFGICAGVFF